MAQKSPAKKAAPKKAAASKKSAAKKAPAPSKEKTKTVKPEVSKEQNATTSGNSATNKSNDRLKHTTGTKGPLQSFTNPFKAVKTKEEAQALKEKFIKTGAAPAPHSCSAVIVNAEFDENSNQIVCAQVKHYDAVKMAWSDPVEVTGEELDNYHH